MPTDATVQHARRRGVFESRFAFSPDVRVPTILVFFRGFYGLKPRKTSRSRREKISFAVHGSEFATALNCSTGEHLRSPRVSRRALLP